LILVSINNNFIKSEGSETEEEATPGKIKKKRLIFMVGKEIRDEINLVISGKVLYGSE